MPIVNETIINNEPAVYMYTFIVIFSFLPAIPILNYYIHRIIVPKNRPDAAEE